MRLLLLLTLLLAVPAQAADVASPPADARIVTSQQRVVLGWKSTARAFVVDVFAGGRAVFSQPQTATSLTIPITPGALYQWRVREVGPGGVTRDVVGLRAFQVSNTLEYRFDGVDGATGARGTQGDLPNATVPVIGVGQQGGPGGPGAAGGRGEEVVVRLEAAGDYVRVTLAGNSVTRFLWAADSEPVKVSANGGRGGDGGPGGAGSPSGARPIYTTGSGYIYAFFSAGAGGRGGSGGAGGDGGTITVEARGVTPGKVMRLEAEGGAGGRGGEGGPGGAGPYGLAGPPGRRGQFFQR